MALLNDAIKDKKYDVRIIERNLVRGTIQGADSDQHLKLLPDDANNCDWRNIEQIDELLKQPRSRA